MSSFISTEQHFRAASPSSSQNDSSFSFPSPPKGMSAPLSTPTSEKHPKGKRKRTATKDKLILEEAYSINPKPDKQARLEIVNRVSLNEKEVQIWFQNRRQNDRRKSRPLSPQELAALRFGTMHTVSSDPITSQSFLVKHDKTPFPSSDPAQSQATVDHVPMSPKAPISPEQSHARSDAIHATPRWTNQNTDASRLTHMTPQRRVFSPTHESHSFSGSIGYISNRWNTAASLSTPITMPRDNSFRYEHFPPSSCSSVKTTLSQSQMRLSLSLEGKAEIVANESSPSRETPSRSSTLPSLSRSLQRSHSALPAITLPPITSLTKSIPQLARGRSRDVHAWELCADADTRDELTTQAEHESNGSAIAEISLLRSTGNILQSSGAKRNAPLYSPIHQAKKLKLGRANSSAARLENILADSDKPRKSPIGKVDVAMLVSPTDSDKENWSPDSRGNIPEGHQRQPLTSPLKMQNTRRLERILQDQNSPSRLSNRAPSEPRVFGKGLEILHDLVRKVDTSREDDVTKFMRGGDVSPSKKGDMDCVAGLLSLSQGAWR
ncbi:hypothetical protein PT974_09177 [Cladobotryum mycophilum]|uniref:Homeobox domain-containing protein n=1 Tax=Cladobotryum mycophilum TaxID=491253 RepID=A0ABR0SGG7_9HYPO